MNHFIGLDRSASRDRGHGASRLEMVSTSHLSGISRFFHAAPAQRHQPLSEASPDQICRERSLAKRTSLVASVADGSSRLFISASAPPAGIDHGAVARQ